MIANDTQTHVLARQRLKVLRIEANGNVIAMPEPEMAQKYIIFWTPFGDEAIYTDGRVEADGNWPAYAMLMDHPANAELLRYPCWLCQGRGTTNDLENEPCEECFGVGTLEYNLGSSDLQATYILIADRVEEEVYVAPMLAGSQFLYEQWPSPPLLTATTADAIVEALHRAMSEMGTPDPKEVERAMQEAQERLEALHKVLSSGPGPTSSVFNLSCICKGAHR